VGNRKAVSPYPLSSDKGSWGAGPGAALAENEFGAAIFICILFVTEPLWCKKNQICLSLTILAEINK